jgi:hypothetical protein
MIFKKNDEVKINGKLYRCIIADEDVAVLGLQKKAVSSSGWQTSYINTRIYANQYEFVKVISGLEAINGEQVGKKG